jgi:predicted acylesterase/phospholipase RssA
MRSVGLVLSGGMLKGAYQIGALRAVGEFFKPSDFSFVSAASIGALNAYAYLTNGLDKGIELWNGVGGGERRFVPAILRSGYLREAVRGIVSDAEIGCSFYVPLVNIRKRTLLYADIGRVKPENVRNYLRACVSLPVFNAGVQINGEHLYDGAMIDNIPIQPLLKHQIDYVVCIYFDNHNYTFESRYLDNKVIKINFPDNKTASDSVIARDGSIERMIDDGYALAKRLLDYVLFSGKDDVNSIYAKIEDLNAMNTGGGKLRVTGDIVVDNMNKITKKFMKRIETR